MHTLVVFGVVANAPTLTARLSLRDVRSDQPVIDGR